MSNVVEVSDLTRTFHNAGVEIQALGGVSLTIKAARLVVLMGASGSGKSTLLHLLGGLDRPTSGSVRVDGQQLADMTDAERTIFRRRKIGIVFQAYNLLPTLDAQENTTLPATLDGRNGPEVEEAARRLLGIMELDHRIHHRPQAMSGGEQQRVAIARALINDPVVLLADEPTGNLDTHHSHTVWRKMRELVDDHGKTVVAVTHEPSGAAYADEIQVLKDGRIVGRFEPKGDGDASDVAARYTELVS